MSSKADMMTLEAESPKLEKLRYQEVHELIQTIDILVFTLDQNALSVLLYGGNLQWTSFIQLRNNCLGKSGDELALIICGDIVSIISFFLHNENDVYLPVDDTNLYNVNKFVCTTLPILVEVFMTRKTLRFPFSIWLTFLFIRYSF